ncbi:putative spermidine/putrescine transport system substrate-binding protein [Nonomuraea maritima]|uniref:Putative spermidine/putrescine transport system substrate-binding protein n=1 Tax=Nonomuraea maritima TaxID=683260 RepID=A0A1G8S4M4_9ACTN|nr:ABC transporter substrate-binding protein [Nonomuraea maritima]SDJ24179.1 putative spermidine/putrescine transport system substrate-binding protein [Nonomuraea maritima]
MSRRGIALAVTGLLVLTACGGGHAASGDGKQLTVVMWGGDDQKKAVAAYVEPWAKANGVTVKQDSPTDYAKFRAQVESKKVSWGVVEVEPNFAVTACENGWAVKLDPAKVDMSKVKKELVSECAAPLLEYAFTIAYNTKAYSAENHPKTWAEFFDTAKFPGKRGFWKYATGAMFEAALLADGVPADQLYPLDIDRAFKKLDTIKKDIVFYETGEQQQQLVSSGEVPLIQAWNGRIFAAAEDGQPVANEWNQHLLSYDQVVIPAGYRDTALAQEWLNNFLADAKGQADYANQSAYAPVTPEALQYVQPDVRRELPTEHEDQRAAIVDYTYWAEHYDEVTERLNEWMAQ